MTLREIAAGSVAFNNIEQLPDMDGHELEAELDKDQQANQALSLFVLYSVSHEYRLLRDSLCYKDIQCRNNFVQHTLYEVIRNNLYS